MCVLPNVDQLLSTPPALKPQSSKPNTQSLNPQNPQDPQLPHFSLLIQIPRLHKIHRPLVGGEAAWCQIYHRIVCRLHSQCGTQLREGCIRSTAHSTTGRHQAWECQRGMLRYVWFATKSVLCWLTVYQPLFGYLMRLLWHPLWGRTLRYLQWVWQREAVSLCVCMWSWRRQRHFVLIINYVCLLAVSHGFN